MRALSLFVLCSCLAAAPPARSVPVDAQARTVLARAREAMAIDRLLSEKGIVIHALGTRDIAVRLQGQRHDYSEPYPLRSVLAVDLVGGRTAFETLGRVNPDADEALRFVYGEKVPTLLADLTAGRAFWIGADDEGAAQRLRNTVPQLLVDRIERDGSIEVRYESTTDDGHAVVAAHPVDGERLLLRFDRGRVLQQVSFLADMPVLERTPVTWRFQSYESVGDVPFPTGHTLLLGERVYEQVRYAKIVLGALDERHLGPPDWIARPAPPAPRPTQSAPASTGAPSAAPSPSPLRPVADGIWLFNNVRSGFHPLIVELANGLLIVDAPAGWHELQQLPPSVWAGGDGRSAAVGERLLNEVRRLLPGKPVRHLVLTHHHGDHIGGVQPFVDAGIEILASPQTFEALHALATHARLRQNRGRPEQFRSVKGEMLIDDPRRPVRLIDVGANPHAAGMLIAYLPEQKILYQSDLFMPSDSPSFPSADRLPIMKWFVHWLDASGLAVEQVLAIHASGRGTTKHLDIVRSR